MFKCRQIMCATAKFYELRHMF